MRRVCQVKRRAILLVLFRGFLLRSLLEPLDKGLGSLADLARGRDVDVLLAGLGAPGDDDLLGDEVVVVVQLQDLDDLLEHIRVLFAEAANQALGTTKQGLFMLLRSDKLEKEALLVNCIE